MWAVTGWAEVEGVQLFGWEVYPSCGMCGFVRSCGRLDVG